MCLWEHLVPELTGTNKEALFLNSVVCVFGTGRWGVYPWEVVWGEGEGAPAGWCGLRLCWGRSEGHNPVGLLPCRQASHLGDRKPTGRLPGRAVFPSHEPISPQWSPRVVVSWGSVVF